MRREFTALLAVFGCVASFVPVPDSVHGVRTHPKSLDGYLIRRNYRIFHNETDIVDNKQLWSLVEDWALVDGVRDFTLHTDGRSFTFWDKIVQTTPEFEGKSASDAQRRYDQLFQELHSQHSNDANFTTNMTIPIAGTIPPVLNEWWISDKDHHVLGIGGTLDDGRKVWFPVHSFGRFDGHAIDIDIIAPCGGPDCISTAALPGGYVEVAGGSVYELGVQQIRPEVAEAGTEFEPNGFQPSMIATVSAIAAVGLLSLLVGLEVGVYVSRETPSASVAEASQQYEFYMGAPVPVQRAAAQDVRMFQEKQILHDIKARINELRQIEGTTR